MDKDELKELCEDWLNKNTDRCSGRPCCFQEKDDIAALEAFVRELGVKVWEEALELVASEARRHNTLSTALIACGNLREQFQSEIQRIKADHE
jgi:hypothetical protein